MLLSEVHAKMINMTSRLAVKIKNIPLGGINWSDNTPQRSRSSLKAEDIIPNEEDGDTTSNRIHHEILGQQFQSFEPLSESSTQAPFSSPNQQVSGGAYENRGY